MARVPYLSFARRLLWNMRPRRLTSSRPQRAAGSKKIPLAARRASLARPALFLHSRFLGPQDAIVSDTAVITPPVGKMPVFALALILLAAIGERQTRCIAGQKTLAAQVPGGSTR
jgi:hypothetical protein